jgi:outer membrane protein, heavy metal efflux system
MTDKPNMLRWGLLAAAVVLAGGCMFKPKETPQLAAELKQQGAPYAKPFEQRQLPELPEPATWRDVLYRVFMANGEVESAYHEWHAAMERTDIASYWPNSNVSLSASYVLGPSGMKAWDRTTLGLGFDQAMPLSQIPKVKKGGEIALQNARQSAEIFRAAKFRVQRQVLVAYYDLALMEEQIRIERGNLQLLKVVQENARGRMQAGGSQQDLLRAQVSVRTSESALADMESQARSMRAMLNGVMARKADAPIVLAAKLPEDRPIHASDDKLIAMGVDQNPELARLAAQVHGRADAIELAKLQYLPDISPTFSITGSAAQSIGAMVTLPSTLPMIAASIREAKAMRDASEAMLRQTRQDKASSFVATLYAMRNARHREAIFAEKVLPASKQLLASSRQDYISGRSGLIELIDAQRTLLEVRRLVAQNHVDAEKRLAELEELAGVDVETLGTLAATRPTTMMSNPANQEAAKIPTTHEATPVH